MTATLTPQVAKVLRYLKDEISVKSIGSPLPPVGEIRKALGVSQLSVQRAFDVLETRGRISRQPRKGIFICDHTQSGEFAIVVRPQLLGPLASPYYALSCNSLVEMTHDRRPKIEARMRFGKPAPSELEYAATLSITQPQVMAKLRGVFSFHPLFDVGQKLQEHGIPVILLGGSHQPQHGEHVVSFDFADAFRQYVKMLITGGCRSVGIIGIAIGRSTKQYIRTLNDMGLETRDEWLLACKTGKDMSIKGGYRQFMRLWLQPNRPDGLIVLDDIMCRGVLQGCLQLGIDLPGDLQLVSHANKGVEFPYHKSVSRLEFDSTLQARHAVELVIQILEGRDPAPESTLVPGRIVVGQTTA